MPVDPLTVATDALPLVHEPEPPSLKEVVAPWHTTSVPDIGVGAGLIIMLAVLEQPPGIV